MMQQHEYISSPKVIFSDKGSIIFGSFIILLMICLALVFTALKLTKKSRVKNMKLNTKQLPVSSYPLKHPFLYKHSKALPFFLTKPMKKQGQ